MTDPRFPIGRHVPPPEVTPAVWAAAIADIAAAPELLGEAVNGLNQAQLETPYREGGWTVAQVVHHLVDSHLNAYIRIKLALTETDPTIRPYDEKAWAALADAGDWRIDTSLACFEAMHARWSLALATLRPEDVVRRLVHPERGPTTVGRQVAMYAWHGRHHVAHITSLRKARGWGPPFRTGVTHDR